MPVSAPPAPDTSLLTLLRQTVESLDQTNSPAAPNVVQKPTTGAPAAPVGSGSTASAGDVPDISANAAATAPGHMGMAVAVASMFSMMPPGKSDDDMEVELASVEAKMKQTTDKVGDNEITTNQERQRNALAAKRDQLKKAQEAMEKAADAQKHASVWDKVKLALSYVGAVLTIAAGVLIALTAPLTGGLGAVAGGLLIAGGVMMLMMAIDQTMSMTRGDGKGFIAMTAHAITEDMYPNDPDKQKSEERKWTMGLTVALMVASAVCGIAGAVVNPAGAVGEVVAGASMAGKITETAASAGDIAEAGEVGETATTAATTGADVETAASDAADGGTEASDVVDAENEAGAVDEPEETIGATKSLKIRVAEKAQEGGAYKKTLGAAEGVNDAANAGAEGPSLYYHYEASTSNASSLNAKAQAKQFEALDKALDDAIDAVMLRLKTDGDRFANVISSLADAVKDHGDSMSHVKFRA